MVATHNSETEQRKTRGEEKHQLRIYTALTAEHEHSLPTTKAVTVTNMGPY